MATYTHSNVDMSLISNLLGDPFWLSTIAICISGWAVALVGCIINVDDISTRDKFPILTWWGIAFEFICIALVVYGVITNGIGMYRQAILALLSIATVYSSNSTNNFIWRSGSTAGAIAAGQILLSIINLIWILYLGTSHDEPVHAAISNFAAPKVSSGYGRVAPPKRLHYPSSNNPGFKSMQSQRAYPQGQSVTTQRQSFHPQYMGDMRGFEHPDMPPSSHSTVSGSTEQSDSLSLPTDYPYKARALYSYSANPEDGNEISFEKDEILEISDITGRWWQARRANGEVGICPSNYVVLL